MLEKISHCNGLQDFDCRKSDQPVSPSNLETLKPHPQSLSAALMDSESCRSEERGKVYETGNKGA